MFCRTMTSTSKGSVASAKKKLPKRNWSEVIDGRVG
jgi:hypothetical protein